MHTTACLLGLSCCIYALSQSIPAPSAPGLCSAPFQTEATAARYERPAMPTTFPGP